MRYLFLKGLKRIVCIKINAVKIHTQDIFMRLIAQVAVKQQLGVRYRDSLYVADGDSFSVEPSLEVTLSLLDGDYETASRNCDDRRPFFCASYRKFCFVCYFY